MAVAYWSFKRFENAISEGYYCIIKYQNILYYVDGISLINLYTLKHDFFFRTLFNFTGSYKIDGKYLKDIWEDVEIVREKSVREGWLSEQLTAAREYERKVIKGGKDPYYNIDIKDDIKAEKRPGMAIQHITYEQLLDKATTNEQEKMFKYKDKIYSLKKKMTKYECREIYPEKKVICEFGKYEDLFSRTRIENKSLEEIWSDCEYIISKKLIGAFPKRYGPQKDINELNEIVYEAQKRLINQGEIQFMRMSTHRFVEFSQVMVLLIFSITVCSYAASVLTMFYDILWLMSDTIVGAIYNLFGFGIVYFAYTTMEIEMPKSIMYNIKKHWKTWLFMLVFEVIYCFKILPFTLLMNVAGLLLGYGLNWIDVKVRLRYAQKVKDGKI